jgi:hypothetical protein
MGFTLQGVPLAAIGTPLGVLALLQLPVHARLPEGRQVLPWPAAGPFSCDESVLSPESQVIPAVDTFLGFVPPEHAPV